MTSAGCNCCSAGSTAPLDPSSVCRTVAAAADTVYTGLGHSGSHAPARLGDPASAPGTAVATAAPGRAAAAPPAIVAVPRIPVGPVDARGSFAVAVLPI